jgi:glycosyltransferase involved in cell wall biosynthesis
MRKTPDTIIVITAYNEEKYLPRFLEKLQPLTKDFLVVDDGSTDQTAKLARQFTPYVISHEVNLGKGAAMKTGADFVFQKLHAKKIIFMDGDDQHSVEDLPNFFALMERREKNICLLGVRSFRKKMPWYRILGNRSASILVNLFFGHYIPDIPSGFKALSKDVYQKLRWKSSDYGVELEMACRCAKQKLPFETIAIKTIYHDMDRGMDLFDAVKMLYKVLLWRINL